MLGHAANIRYDNAIFIRRIPYAEDDCFASTARRY